MRSTPRSIQECRELKAKAKWLAFEMQWGTLGEDGRGEPEFIKLRDLETDHLENILVTQHHIQSNVKATILHILKRRYNGQDF
jgi:hypothetical protein